MDKDEKDPGLKLVHMDEKRKEKHPNEKRVMGEIDPGLVECGNEIMRILKERGYYLQPFIESLGGGVFRPAIQLKKVQKE